MKLLFVLFVFSAMSSVFIQAQYLRVSENGRYLETDDGKPFFWLADTAWELVHRLDLEEAERYLRNRAAKGFTVVQVVLLAECNGLTDPTPDGHLPLEDLNPTRPNEAYFQHVDKVVSLAAEQEIYLAMLPTWGAHAQNKAHPLFENHSLFSKETARAYGRFLGERYRDAWNIVWVLGGDRSPKDTEDIWDSMASGLKEGDGGKRLISYHPGGGHATTEYFPDTPWLDFHMRQSGHDARDIPVWEDIGSDYLTHPAKPVLNAEPAYEQIPIGWNEVNGRFDAYDIRKSAYLSVFAGAFGHSYGHNSVWQMFEEGREPIVWAEDPWDVAIDSPVSYQMRHLRSLMESRPFLSRIPDQSLLLTEENFGSAYIQVTRDGVLGEKDASYIMAYLSIARGLKLDTSVIEGGRLKAWWYDPRTGLAYFIESFENEGTYSPKWEDRVSLDMGGPDWVLVIDDAERGYGKPGS